TARRQDGKTARRQDGKTGKTGKKARPARPTRPARRQDDKTRWKGHRFSLTQPKTTRRQDKNLARFTKKTTTVIPSTFAPSGGSYIVSVVNRICPMRRLY
ncbi:hypothetical protein BC936DRAFT_142941, partial [Jimgerdemannia flammicorona]